MESDAIAVFPGIIPIVKVPDFVYMLDYGIIRIPQRTTLADTHLLSPDVRDVDQYPNNGD